MGCGCKVGACGRYTRVNEYVTTLAVGLILRDLLEAEGATVVITRTKNNVSTTNIERTRMMNRAGVDVALHLHCDSVSSTSVHGLGLFVRDSGAYDTERAAMAKTFGKAMCALTGAVNHGVKKSGKYMSLNYAETPAIVIEMGFISNKKEDILLSTDENYQQKTAQGIIDGICEYFGR